MLFTTTDHLIATVSKLDKIQFLSISAVARIRLRTFLTVSHIFNYIKDFFNLLLIADTLICTKRFVKYT